MSKSKPLTVVIKNSKAQMNTDKAEIRKLINKYLYSLKKLS